MGKLKVQSRKRTSSIRFKIVLKELRETSICLKIIKRKPLIKPPERVDSVLCECDELISIFVTSVSTAKRNRKK
jgi:four helix bundle protein